MEASASNAPCTPSHAFIVEGGAPLAGPLPPVVENPMPPYYLAYGPCESTCAQGTEGPSAQGTERTSILYSPSNAQVLQSEQVFVEPEQRDEEYNRLFAEMWRLNFVFDNLVQGAGFHAQYTPSYQPASANFPDENTGAFLSLLSQDRSELYSRADWSLLQQDVLQPPELPIRGLFESHGWRQSSLRPTHSSPGSEQLMVEITSSRQSLHTNGKKASAEAEDSSEKEAAEKHRCTTDFDCNICLDIAKEPVVTSCGHLFCWSCLYRWLHIHSDHKECPVCKGEVTEANVTPIYGRGCSKSDADNKDEENSDSGLPIPPRPRGNRVESFRQRFYTISRRVGEGIANYWRHFLNYQIHNRSRFSGHEDSFMQEILSESPAILIRSMTRRLQREQGITEGGPSTVERFPRDGGTESGQGIHCFPANDRLAAMNSEIGTAAGRFTENSNFYESTSSVNSPHPGQFVSIPIVGARPATHQPSASGNVAVISNESSARDALVESLSAGSSRPSKRLRGSSSSGSSDDGENVCKRRRLH